MSVDITIQETVNEVDITVNQNVITVNVTRTTGGGGVDSINGETGVVVLTTDNVNEGLINLYFTAARVRATVLTGISFVSGIAITATDTILSAFGKLQKQISSLGAVAFSNNYNDLDNKPTIPSPQTLAETLAIDNKTNDIPIVSNNGKGSVYINDDYASLGYGPQSFAMTDDDVQLYSEAPVVFDSTVSTDFNTPILNYNNEEIATQTWVTTQGGGNLPYQELIFTAVQTAPQTGITSGTLIEGGRYTITNADITADFVISGAADNEIGTIFIANATPPDWGVLGELSFEGNPIVTILNNPLSDTYTSHYTSPGCYYLEGLLDFPVDTFPKLGADDNVDNVVRSQSDGIGPIYKSYLWHKDNFNDKRILIKTMTGEGANLEDGQLNGTQLFIVKIFNS